MRPAKLVVSIFSIPKAIRAGVWDHSTFKVDPIRRMVNTGNAAMALTYGPRKAAETTFARVTRMHERVSGLRA